jgi:chitin synthase
MVSFALITTYMLVRLSSFPCSFPFLPTDSLCLASFTALIRLLQKIAAGVITYYGVKNAIDDIKADGGSVSVGDIFSNHTFATIVVSLLSTYGLYLIASLIFLDVRSFVAFSSLEAVELN